MEEFRCVISYFLDFESEASAASSSTETAKSEVLSSAKAGTALTAAGPAKYGGDILEDPDLLWAEDAWNEEREEEARERLGLQGQPVPQFWRNKYENQSPQYWHDFYKRNEDNFYKDRHYLHIVFPDLLTRHAELPSSMHSKSNQIYLLEVGCGVGNAVLPLLEVNPDLFIYAFDIAPSAISILQQHELYVSSGRMSAAVHNIADDNAAEADLRKVIRHTDCILSRSDERRVHYALCMFVLSAIAPQRHAETFKRLSNSLVSGGKMFMRDYGRYDEAQLRFKKGSKISDNFYVRQDGTCSYFFATDELSELASNAGMQVEECYYIRRQYANRGKKEARYRVWIHAVFVKI